jgi:hypothetical protein
MMHSAAEHELYHTDDVTGTASGSEPHVSALCKSIDVRCSGFDRGLHSRMLLGLSMLLRVKPCHTCDLIACLSAAPSLTAAIMYHVATLQVERRHKGRETTHQKVKEDDGSQAAVGWGALHALSLSLSLSLSPSLSCTASRLQCRGVAGKSALVA